jgi:Flp pilus assembly protein TadD
MIQNLSACILLRVPAEEEFLHVSLSCFGAMVDDVFILDMGQNSFAERFAEQYGARVVHASDEPHEAAMLNVMLREAKHEWLIYMDADEFVWEGHELIPQLMNDGHTQAASVRTIHFEDPMSTFDEPRSVRLLHRKPGLHFSGTIEPQPVLPDQAVAVDSQIKIAHRAYLQDEIIIQKNHQRVAYFGQHLEQHPEDRWARNKFGTYLMAIREWSEAQAQFEQLVETTEAAGESETPLLLLRASTCALSQQNSELALKYSEQAAEMEPTFSDAYFMMGTILAQHQRTDEAEVALQKALDLKEQAPYFLLADESMSTWKPLNELVEIYRSKNMNHEAVHYAERSLEVYPTNYRTHLLLATLYKRLNRSDEARKAYQAALKINPNLAQKIASK